MSTFAFQQLVRFGVSTAGAEWMASRVTVRSLNSDDVLIPFGSTTHDWHMVIGGYVGTYLPAGDKTCGSPIELFGPNTWLDVQLHTPSHSFLLAYKCLTAVEVLALPSHLVRNMLLKEPAFAMAVAQHSLARANRLNGLSIVTRCGSYALRTFWTLAQVVEDQTRSMASCADDTPLQRCTIPLNQVELARMIGISRTHLSACLLALERAGFLNIHYGSVELMACPLWLVLLNHLHQHGLGDCSQSVEGLMTSLDSLQTTQTNCQQRRLDNTPEGHLPRCETCERRQLMTLRGLISSPRPGH